MGLSEHYHWFYSTLAQSLAALIAIMSVFVIFRLQNLTDNLSRKFADLIDLLHLINAGKLYTFKTREFIVKKSKEIIEQNKKFIEHWNKESINNPSNPMVSVHMESLQKYQDQNTTLSSRLTNINNIRSFITLVRRSFIGILVFLFVLFYISLFLLKMSNVLAKIDFGQAIENYVTYVSLFGIVLLSVFCATSIRRVGEE